MQGANKEDTQGKNFIIFKSIPNFANNNKMQIMTIGMKHEITLSNWYTINHFLFIPMS